MLLKITEKCSMGCTHCMNNATPDGQHMSEQVFDDSLDFLIKNNVYQSIILSGGEPTEHPNFVFLIQKLISKFEHEKKRTIVTITSNGFWCLDNPEVSKTIAKGSEYVTVFWQISTDKRFYPKELPLHKKLWREEHFDLCEDCVEQVYPQGRALTNKIPWQSKASRCFNVRAITKQLPNPTVESVVNALMQRQKFCTPAIRIDGTISVGESDLCPKMASIYDSSDEIIRKIKEFKCHQCDHVNNNLSPMYKQFL